MNIHENEEVAELPIPIKSEVEYAIKQLKNGKSPGIDNISSELIKEGCTVLTELCMDYKDMAKHLDNILNNTITNKK